MSKQVETRIEGQVAEVMLNRPDRYNALDVEMFEDLDTAARELTADRSVRAVVLHGAGENFCAGIDMAAVQAGGEAMARKLLAPVKGSPANLAQRAAYAWRELPVPVICALQGTVFGGGFQVALGADLRIAAGGTQFSIMESKWGLVPDMAISATARDILGPDKVKELAWTARVFDAAEALQLGLVTRIDDEPLAVARDLAGAISQRSPDAVRGVKRLINESWSRSEEEALQLEARIQMKILAGPNQAEAVRANFEKRSPEFSD